MRITPPGNGCKRHPDCFTCPFPDCCWGQREWPERLPAAEIREWLAKGLSVADLAALWRVRPSRIVDALGGKDG